MTGCILVAAAGVGGEAAYSTTRKDRTAKEVLTDQWIFAKVRSSLDSDSRITSRNITVEVHKGVVILSGKVPNADERALAEHVTKIVDGVKSVVNKLKAG